MDEKVRKTYRISSMHVHDLFSPSLRFPLCLRRTRFSSSFFLLTCVVDGVGRGGEEERVRENVHGAQTRYYRWGKEAESWFSLN